MIEVEVEDPAWRNLDDVQCRVARAAKAALTDDDTTPDDAHVVVLLTDDETVRELNARFRGQDRPTNVLSFPSPPGAGGSLGDIALAAGVCAREAAAQGKRLEDHLAHLVVHGVLHLLGCDHVDDGEAEAMEARERAVLAGLGIGDPYRGETADG